LTDKILEHFFLLKMHFFFRVLWGQKLAVRPAKFSCTSGFRRLYGCENFAVQVNFHSRKGRGSSTPGGASGGAGFRASGTGGASRGGGVPGVRNRRSIRGRGGAGNSVRTEAGAGIVREGGGWGRRHICAVGGRRPDGGGRGRRGLYSAGSAQKTGFSGVDVALDAGFWVLRSAVK
jgi:hypothetical protein